VSEGKEGRGKRGKREAGREKLEGGVVINEEEGELREREETRLLFSGWGEERGKAGEEPPVAYLEAKRVAREEGVLECSYED
jgi:hypothetical protein